MPSSPPPPPQAPETYYCPATTHCPNSPLPVLVYRNVLPTPLTEEAVRAFVEPNEWRHGGTFKHYGNAHFHSVLSSATPPLSKLSSTDTTILCVRVKNTHEAYFALRGATKCLYGVGPLDDHPEDKGIEFEMRAGDVAVHAAGVSHRNVESSEDYLYMGLYPKGAPKWNNNYCKADAEETRAKAEEAKGIPVPEYDPIYGLDGPLPMLWRAASG